MMGNMYRAVSRPSTATALSWSVPVGGAFNTSLPATTWTKCASRRVSAKRWTASVTLAPSGPGPFMNLRRAGTL